MRLLDKIMFLNNIGIKTLLYITCKFVWLKKVKMLVEYVIINDSGLFDKEYYLKKKQGCF